MFITVMHSESYGKPSQIELVSASDYKNLKRMFIVATEHNRILSSVNDTLRHKCDQAIVNKYKLQNKLTVKLIKARQMEKYADGFSKLYFEQVIENKRGACNGQ